MAHVILNGWKPGLRKVALTKLIQVKGQLDLAEAKGCTDRLLDGEKVEIPFGSLDQAETFAQEASALGATAEIKEHR